MIARHARAESAQSASRIGVRAGFTLIEMLVVISIIALLIAFLLPVLQASRESARLAACASNLHQQHLGTLAYANDHQGRLPHLWIFPGGTEIDQIQFTHWTRWAYVPEPDSGDGPWQNLGRLVPGGHMSEPRAYFCPSQPFEPFTFDHYNDPWPTPNTLSIAAGSVPGIRLSYNFNPRMSDGVVGASPAQQTRRYQRAAEIDSGDVFIMDLVESPQTIAHRVGGGGFNVCRGDGSVAFASDPTVIQEVEANPLIAQQDYTAWDQRVLDVLRAP